VVTAVAHWAITSHNHLCVGTGETWLGGTDDGEETLPQGWNNDQTLYTLRYFGEAGKLLLKVLSVGDSLIFSMLRVKDSKSADVTICPGDYVNRVEGDFRSMFSNKDGLVELVKKNLVKPLLIAPAKSATKSEEADKNKRKATVKEEKKLDDKDPLRVEPRRPRLDPGMPSWGGVGPPPVGGSDLDPMGGIMGGGMIMDPRQGGRSMDPRYDPVGPGFPGEGVGRGRGGRLGFGDAMRPPGWNDDEDPPDDYMNMYM